MNIFTVNSPNQALVIDQIKNSGAEVIQTSNGLLVKTHQSLSELESSLEDATVLKFDINGPDISKDARIFAGLE